MRNYFKNYCLNIVQRGNFALSKAIQKTVDDVVPKYISSFSYRNHVVGLLAGDVQSGKTSHMFGLMSAAADEGFGVFVLLTTDNNLLQQQTFQRANRDLCDFCVCNENDYLKFTTNNMRKPAVIVLKKNGHVLRQWKNNFASARFVAGNPIFIVDDEADAASLNTLVNKNKQSTINKCLDEIKRTASSSIYLQVTGTPQSILLQSIKSGWKPYFVYYFHPGSGYMGGNFFFEDPEMKHIILTDNAEATELLDEDDEFPENGLKTALRTHLVSSAHIMLNGGKVCNFLIHPSFKVSEHNKFAEKIGNYLNDIFLTFDEDETINILKSVYETLQKTKQDIEPFERIKSFIWDQMKNDQINILILNSVASFEENTRYEIGNNIIIGGNSLGRGVTFPQLQTIYYCRVAKNPQADTMWQHARMFGYDRDPDLLRVFMPPKLFKLFSDINRTNNSIISQIDNAANGVDIKIYYPSELRPTRKNVLDNKVVGIYTGGVNYFPFYPTNKSIEELDELLKDFEDNVYSVSLKFVVNLLECVGSECDDWNAKAFIGFVNSFIADNPLAQGTLIIRRNRDVSKGSGTLLSPNDRALGDSFKDTVVLTMYKVTGSKGWNNLQLWIPNIKLPGEVTYYSGDFMNM